MSLAVHLLGPPRVSHETQIYELPPGKTSALLYYLAYSGGWVTRDQLVYLLWPDSDEEAAKKISGNC